MSEKTTNRLKEVADLLAMVEEIMGSPLSGKSSISAGMRITVRNARESVIRSCIEVHREATEQSIPESRITADNRLEQNRLEQIQSEQSSHDISQHHAQQIERNSHVLGQPSRSLIPEITTEVGPSERVGGTSMGLSDRLLNRKRDLRASIERMVDRSE